MSKPQSKPPVPISGADFLTQCPIFNPDRRRCRNKRCCDLKANHDTSAHEKAIRLRKLLLDEDYRSGLTEKQMRDLVKKLLGWIMCTKHQAIDDEVVERLMEGLREEDGVFVGFEKGGDLYGKLSGGVGRAYGDPEAVHYEDEHDDGEDDGCDDGDRREAEEYDEHEYYEDYQDEEDCSEDDDDERGEDKDGETNGDYSNNSKAHEEDDFNTGKLKQASYAPPTSRTQLITPGPTPRSNTSVLTKSLANTGSKFSDDNVFQRSQRSTTRRERSAVLQKERRSSPITSTHTLGRTPPSSPLPIGHERQTASIAPARHEDSTQETIASPARPKIENETLRPKSTQLDTTLLQANADLTAQVARLKFFLWLGTLVWAVTRYRGSWCSAVSDDY